MRTGNNGGVVVRNVQVMGVLVIGLIAQGAWSVSPGLSNILPRGAARGAEVELRFIGSNLGDAVGLVFHESGLTLTEIKEATPGQVTCVLKIAEDCKLGGQAIRVRTSTGLSNVRLFSVGALEEVQEVEPNGDAASAQALSVGTTVNGVITTEDVDYFAVDLAANARIAVEIEALRLGRVLFDVKVRFFGPQGHELVAEDDTALLKQDAGFVYTTHEAGRHVIAVSEASYGGSADDEYRLHVGIFPRPFAVTPMGGVPGSTVAVRWLGDPGMTSGEIVLADGAPGAFSIVPANDLGVAPTPMPFRLSEYPGVLETEPNDTRETATPGNVPGAFDGIIAQAGDMDWYRFEGTKGQNLDLRVWARALGSPLDSVVKLLGPSGNQILANDDGVGMDSSGRITLPEDGAYSISVRDHLGRGGEVFAYRVEVTPVKPELWFTLPEIEPASVVVPRGNHRLFVLGTTRKNFDGQLTVEFLDLPPGLTAEHGTMNAGQTRMPVIFSAAADAPTGAALTQVRGVFKNDAMEVVGHFQQRIPLVYGRNKAVFLDYSVDRLAVGVTDEAPFTIEAVVPKVPAVQLGKIDLRIVATRAEGFTAPIQLEFPWLPRGFGAGTATIKEGQNEATLRLESRRDAPVGEHKLALLGTSGGFYVSTPFVPIQVSEQWVSFALEPVQAEQGRDFEWVANMTAAQQFEGTFQVELKRLPKGVTSEPQPFTAATTEVRFPVKVAPDAAIGKHPLISMGAVLESAGEPIAHGFSGAPLTVFAPLPPKLQAPPPPPPAVQAGEPEKPKRRTRFPEAT